MDLKEKIVKNKEKFDKTNETYNILTKELLDYLGEKLDYTNFVNQNGIEKIKVKCMNLMKT